MRTWLLGVAILLLPTAAAASDRCVLDGHAGIADTDAATAGEIVCAEVDKRLIGGSARYHVKLGKLGSQIVLTLEAEGAAARTEREQLVLSSIEEVPVAAPRLVDALGQHIPVAETIDVTNVVGGETRVPKKRPSEVHGTLQPLVLVLPGLGTSGGLRSGISFGGGRWSFGIDTTLAGYSFTGLMNVAGDILQDSTTEKKNIVKNPAVGYAALAGGARFHFSDGDTSPWIGAGFAFVYSGVAQSGTNSYGDSEDHDSNVGGAGYAEIGIDFARTRMFGATIGARIDAPTYALTTTTVSGGYGGPVTTTHASQYVPIATFGIGLRL
jgi:hypothetical protein